jgi:hypothetical protein
MSTRGYLSERSGRSSPTVPFEVYLIHEAESAFLVSEDHSPHGSEDLRTKVWLPKRQIENLTRKMTSHGVVLSGDIPEWLAMEKGLI